MALAAGACPFTESHPDCFTASWYLIWAQLQSYGLFQLPILALSVVYEWLELANDARLERLRTLFDAPLINVVNYILQVATCLYVCIAWVVRGGALAVSFSSWSVESILLIFTAIGYATRWGAAKHKVRFTVQLHSLLDLLSIISHFTISFQTHDARRSWLDFGFVRTYILYVVLDHLFTRFKHKTFLSQVLLVIFKAFCLVFFAACVLFSLERLGDLPYTDSFLLHVYKCSTADGASTILVTNGTGTTAFPQCTETWSFFSSIYFMFVTVSTVGYGDFSPKTVLGQLMVCVIIVVGIYTFANESAALFSIYGDQRFGGVRYNVSRNTAHVVVTGNPSAAQMKDFIREFFHPDHDAMFDSEMTATSTRGPQGDDEDDRLSAVVGRRSSADPVLEEGGGKPRAPSESDAFETTRSQSDAGVLATKWMQRKGASRVRETHIVILLRFIEDGADGDGTSGGGSGKGGGSSESSTAFQQEVMQFVADNPRYSKRVFLLFGSPLRAKDLERARVQEAMAVFFLPNKFANDGSREDAATVLRVLSVSQHVNREQTQLFAMLANSENRMLLEAAGLSSDNLVCADALRLGLMGLSCRCPGLSTLISNLITSRSADLPIDSELVGHVKPWIREYVTGAGHEIYSCTLAAFLHGLTFTQCTQRIHHQSGGQVLLIAVEHETQTFFNPGHSFRIPPHCRAFLIAESMTAVSPFAASTTQGTATRRSTMSGYDHLAAPSTKIQHKLLARARRAQHNVERRLPQDVRDYVVRCGGRLSSLPAPSHPPVGLIIEGGHIVVCSNIGSEGAVGARSLSRLVSFLRPLRAAHIERVVPVVIVDSSQFDAMAWLQLSEFGEVYHVVGSPQKHHVLASAGVYTASAIVVLAQGTDEGYDDSKAIFNAVLINAALQQSNIFTIIELRDVHNNKFLDPVHSFSARSATDLLGSDEESRLFENANSPSSALASHRVSTPSHLSNGYQRDSAHRVRSRSQSQSVAKKLTWWDHKKRSARQLGFYLREFFWGSLHNAASRMHNAKSVDVAAALDDMLNGDDNDTFFQERFMYGALFPSYVADDLLIQSFFNPSLNEFIRKILDGTSCFMLYDLPKEWRHGTQTYGELFDHMISGIVSALPIGLLRAKGGPSGAPHPYVYTSPAPSTLLHPEDKVFVLIDVTSIHRVANKLQRRFRGRREAKRADAKTAVPQQTTSAYV